MKTATPSSEESTEQARMESVWRRRAVWLSRRTVSSPAGQDELRVIVLKIGDERYGIELASVAEVLPAVCCTPVPGAPPAVAGVINAYGEIRPVIDLRSLLGVAHGTQSGAPSPVILLRKHGRLLGLKADRVEQVLSIAAGDLRSAGDGLAGLPTRYLAALTKDTLMLLNTDALLADLSLGDESAI